MEIFGDMYGRRKILLLFSIFRSVIFFALPYRSLTIIFYQLRWQLIGVSRRTALTMVFMGSAIPPCLCLNAMLQVFHFAANIMFITSIIKISVLCSQESFPTRIRATAYSIAMSF